MKAEWKPFSWSSEECRAFGTRPGVTRHRLHETDLFSDDALVDLLDRYPRGSLQAFTMGTDPLRRKDWKPVAIGDATGSEVLAAVRKGRLWLNILRVEEADQTFHELIERLHEELRVQCPHFAPVRTTGTLLLSSPSAMVYYHVDGPPNMLWHIRGSKRVYVYPSGDQRLISQDIMEDVFASVADEEMPYEESFDQFATTFELRPGDVASWPQNAPHRVVNLDTLNISLSTNHTTERSERRKLVFLANRFFRRKLRLPVRSTGEEGLAAEAKVFAYRAARKLGLDKVKPSFDYTTDLRLDPQAPLGVARFDSPIRAEFSR